MTLGTPFHPAVMMVHNAIHVSDLAMINTPNLGITFQWNVQNMAGDAMTLGMVSRHHIGPSDRNVTIDKFDGKPGEWDNWIHQFSSLPRRTTGTRTKR